MRIFSRWCRSFVLCFALLATATVGIAQQEGVVEVRVNFVALKSSSGRVNDVASSVAVGNNNADAMLETCNGVMRRMQYGIRFVRSGNIQYVQDSQSTPTDDYFPMKWDQRDGFIDTINSNKIAWKYSDTALNFYLFDVYRESEGDPEEPAGVYMGGGGAGWRAPQNTVVQGSFAYDPGLHEMGHWMGLPHTFLDSSASDCTTNSVWQDEGFSDTLRDSGAYIRSLDTFAQCMYGTNYTALADPAQILDVGAAKLRFYAKLYYDTEYNLLPQSIQDNVIMKIPDFPNANEMEVIRRAGISCNNFGFGNFYGDVSFDDQMKIEALINNIESYHPGKGDSTRTQFTEQQFGRICDHLSTEPSRIGTTSGKFWFVDRNAGGSGIDRSATPYNTVAAAVNSITPAQGKRDMVYLKPGNYSGAITISKPCVIRAQPLTSAATHQRVLDPASIGRN